LDEHGRVQRKLEFVRELGHALFFALAAAIGEQDEGDAVLL